MCLSLLSDVFCSAGAQSSLGFCFYKHLVPTGPKTRTTEEVDRYDNSSDTALVPTGIADARPRSADREPSRSVTQLVLKEKATNLNRRPPIYGRTDEQRANQAALAIDARVDTADAFTA